MYCSPEDSSWIGYFNRAVSTTAAYLPTQVTDTLNQSRAVATVTIPPSSTSSPMTTTTVAVAQVSRQQRLLLASTDGYLYIYNLPDLATAAAASTASAGTATGECILVKQHRIDPDCSTASPGSGAAAAAAPGHVERSEPILMSVSKSDGDEGDNDDDAKEAKSFEESPPPTFHRPDDA